MLPSIGMVVQVFENLFVFLKVKIARKPEVKETRNCGAGLRDTPVRVPVVFGEALSNPRYFSKAAMRSGVLPRLLHWFFHFQYLFNKKNSFHLRIHTNFIISSAGGSWWLIIVTWFSSCTRPFLHFCGLASLINSDTELSNGSMSSSLHVSVLTR